MFCVSGGFDCSIIYESHVFVGGGQRSGVSRDQWILLCDTICTSPNNDSVTLAPSLAESRITWYSSEILPFWHLKKNKSPREVCKYFLLFMVSIAEKNPLEVNTVCTCSLVPSWVGDRAPKDIRCSCGLCENASWAKGQKWMRICDFSLSQCRGRTGCSAQGQCLLTQHCPLAKSSRHLWGGERGETECTESRIMKLHPCNSIPAQLVPCF